MRYDIIDALVDLVTAESRMPSVIITSHAAIKEINKLRAENESLMALAKLGRWVLDMRSEHNSDDLDIETKSIELGLLVEVMATEPCGEGCYCNSWSTFPQKCLRLSDKAKVLKNDPTT